MSDNLTQDTKKPTKHRPFAGKVIRLTILIAAPLIVAAGYVYIFRFDPNAKTGFYLPCFIHFTTGFYCPSCGNTRALHALVHLDFAGVVNNNLLFLPLFVMLFWLLSGEYLKLLLGRRVLWTPNCIPIPMIILFAVVVVAFTVLRNLPYAPCNFLAPGY